MSGLRLVLLAAGSLTLGFASARLSRSSAAADHSINLSAGGAEGLRPAVAPAHSPAAASPVANAHESQTLGGEADDAMRLRIRGTLPAFDSSYRIYTGIMYGDDGGLEKLGVPASSVAAYSAEILRASSRLRREYLKIKGLQRPIRLDEKIYLPPLDETHFEDLAHQLGLRLHRIDPNAPAALVANYVSEELEFYYGSGWTLYYHNNKRKIRTRYSRKGPFFDAIREADGKEFRNGGFYITQFSFIRVDTTP